MNLHFSFGVFSDIFASLSLSSDGSLYKVNQITSFNGDMESSFPSSYQIKGARISLP